MAGFAYQLGKRLAMEKPASGLFGAGAGGAVRGAASRVGPWLMRQGGRLLSRAKPVVRQAPSAARNWWSRASEFNRVKPLWDLGWKANLGLYGAQSLGLTPKFADPALNAYFWWSMPKTMMFEKAMDQLFPDEAPAAMSQGAAAADPNAAYLQAVAPQMGWYPPQPPTPNYFAAVFGKPR